MDFGKTKLMRDALGSPIPQYWDEATQSWRVQTTQGSSGRGGNANIHVSTQDPTNDVGTDGDLWIKYEEANE